MTSGLLAGYQRGLAGQSQVTAVELQGHGRTADIGRPLRCELLADDIAALFHHLGLDRADVAGYSLGAGVALQLALRHPGRVRRLVGISVHQRGRARTARGPARDRARHDPHRTVRPGRLGGPDDRRLPRWLAWASRPGPGGTVISEAVE